MTFPVYPVERTLALRNEQYFDVLSARCQDARKRIWAAIFIVNPRVRDDELLRVRELLGELGYARWRAVDVRVLIGTSHVEDIEVANQTARRYLEDLGVPVRSFVGPKPKSLHSKYVLFDDELIVVGSHNWTPGAASGHSEDSVAVWSPELSVQLREEFLANWERAAPAAE